MLFRIVNFIREFWYLGMGYLIIFSYLLLVKAYFSRKKFSRRFKLIWGNVFIFLMIFIHLIYGLEIYFRYVYDQTDSYQALLTTQRWFKRHVYDTGQLTQPFALSQPIQFRDSRDLRQPKPVGVKRIAVIGDSITYGYGIKRIEDRYSNLLEAKLRGDGFPIEVYNISQPGADIPQEKEFFSLAADSGEFDLIIWGFYLNDIFASPSAQITRFKEQTLARRQNPLFNDLNSRSYVFDFFYVRSILFWSDNLNDYLFSYLKLYEDELSWKQAEQNIKEIISRVKQKNKPLAVVIFPLTNLIGPDYPGAIAHRRLTELFAREKVPLVDLAPAYSQYEPAELMVNRYDAHPNELGHRLAAEQLYRLLTEKFATIIK